MFDFHLDEDTIFLYLDGELGSAETEQIDTHLTDCSECAAQVEAMQSLFATIEAVNVPQLEIDVAPAVVAALTPAPPRSLRWMVFVQIIVAGIALALVWPTVLGQLVLPQFDLLTQTLVSEWSNQTATIAAQLDTLQANWMRLLNAQQQFSSQIDWNYSNTLLLTIALSGLFVGILGNTFLLRSNQLTANS